MTDNGMIWFWIALIIFLCLSDSEGAEGKEYNAILTHYCKCQKCCGWEYNKKGVPVFNYGHLKGKKKIVGKTASGNIAIPYITLAMPKEYPFNTKVYDNGGNTLLGICHDRGGAIHSKDGTIRIDKYVSSHEEALELGVKKIKIDLIVLPDMDSSKIIRVIK
jgi:3D (Asp-Asp-Asp) domain-containing protein